MWFARWLSIVFHVNGESGILLDGALATQRRRDILTSLAWTMATE